MTLPAEADLVVVGAGLMGAAAAWAATRRGLGVVVVEQFDLGHARGSSHGSARIVRRAYPDPLYARMTGPAFDSWADLEADTGAALVRVTGGIDHGARRDVPRIAATLRDLGVPHEVLPAREAERRWPGLAFTGPVLHHPQAGTVDAAAAVAAACARAAERGAVLAPRTRVTGLRVRERLAGGQEVVVATDRGEVRAPRVVVAAGAWAPQVLGGALTGARVELPPLAVTQQQVFHFARRPGVPEWPVEVHKEALSTYSLPGGADGGPGGARKVAEHLAQVPAGSSAGSPVGSPVGSSVGAPTTPEERSGVVDPAARRRLIEHVERCMPGLVPEPFAEATCLYTTTPDEDFVLDRVGPVVVCSPCSGHGAKFAALVGELVVDLATGATGGPRAGLLAEPRFRTGAHRAPGARSAALV